MNIQNPTNTRATEGVWTAHQNSIALDDRVATVASAPPRGPRAVPAENRRTSSPSNQTPASMEKLQEATDSSIPKPSPAPWREIISPESSTYTGSGGGISSLSVALSVISKASTLSTKREGEMTTGAAFLSRPTNENEPAPSTSTSHGNEIDENDESDGSLVPAYITATVLRPAPETIFTPRAKELHFLSVIFRQDCESWLNDNFISDDDGDDYDDPQDDSTTGYTEYIGRTNFVPRSGSYRKSHEIGALCFAETLQIELDETLQIELDASDDDADDETLIAMPSQ